MKRTLCLLVLAVSGFAHAQIFGDANWQEGPVPEPPAFQLDRLLRFDVNPNSAMVYAIDPQTLSISASDRVVRYVLIASSPTGVKNVFYEGIRCPTGQVKTYARHSEGRWVVASDPQWQDMASRPSRHAWQLARQGACQDSGTPSQVQSIVRSLNQASRVDTAR